MSSGQFPGGTADHPEVAGGVSHCYRHPNREATIRCTRCDRPICGECMRPAPVGFHCPDDVAAANKALPRQRTSVGAYLRHSTPWVTISMVVANVVVYLITVSQSTRGLTHITARGLFAKWQLQPLQVHQSDQYYRFITTAFLHLSLLHIASNMLALAVIGPPLERLIGWWRFLALYFLCALGGSVAVYFWGEQLVAVAGASGAIFGLFGASVVLVRRLGLDLQWLLAIIALNFFLTFSIAGISKLAHVGGFAVGLLAGVVIGGLPSQRRAVPLAYQAAGLVGIAALLVVLISVRSATF